LSGFNTYNIYINSLTWLELASGCVPSALRVSCGTGVRPHGGQLCWQVVAVLLAALSEAGIWPAVNVCNLHAGSNFLM